MESPMNAAPPRFACDVMLGSTARWLRMMGIDTFYDNQAADADLKRLCLEEKRILLTKDAALHGSMPVGTSRRVEAVHTREQLREIAGAFQLVRFILPPRCSLCNGELAALGKDAVEGLVPSYVFRSQQVFQRCSRCARIYWPGTHLAKISDFIAAVRNACD
ncbi:MAG: Mut7-C RNAse domain-containing protein [Acidobacteria bacterium]|jgi:hypothetical protein|nr:Mut7-C RNAse domain-containing protein [Acidobacteriota bacterium]